MSYFVSKSTPYGKVKSAEDEVKNVNTVCGENRISAYWGHSREFDLVGFCSFWLGNETGAGKVGGHYLHQLG